MKNLKKLLFIIIGAFSMGAIVTSCNDFSEEDLLKLQVELGDAEAAKAVTALNAAGELVSFQLKIVDTDGAGIEGLTITLAAAAEGGTADNQELTTDVSGLVFYDRVAIGGNSVTVSGANIVDALLTVDFGQIRSGTHYQIINGAIIPTPVIENAVITVISTATATATVQGNVIIETDVTNTTPEFPQDVTIIADFDDNLTSSSSVGINYFFATNDNALTIGTATVDNTTGAYTMTVPAGVRFDMLIPDVQFSQRIAVNEVDNIVLPQPEYRDVITNFGDLYNTDNNTPAVVGARVVYEAPGTPGDGFTLSSFTRVGRALQSLTLNGASEPITEPYEDQTDIVTQFTSLGSGYIASPMVTITDPTGTDAHAEARIEFAITGLTLTNAGTGYAASTTYQFDLYYDEIEDAAGTVDPDKVQEFSVLTVETDAAGVFQPTDVATALADAIANEDNFFDPSDLDQIADNISNLRLVNTDATTDATITVSAATGRVYGLYVMDNGDGNYTNPSFAFSGGGGTTQAVLNVLQFGTQWSFSLDNSGVTTPYPLLPSGIEFEYFEIDDDTRDIFQTTTIQNDETFATNSLIDLLTVDVSGNIQWIDQTASYQTTISAHEAPRPIITRNEGNIAEGSINTGNIDLIDGSISGMNVSDQGSGYIDRFSITIEPSAVGAPGSGAIVEMRDGQFLNTGEFDWSGQFNIVNQGSGFLRNLNQVNGDRNFEVNGSTSTNPYLNRTLSVGQTYIVDIDYGTGVRSENID